MPRAFIALALLLTACPGKGGGFTEFNTAPSCSISNPVTGSAFDQYQTVTFTARVADDQDAPQDLLITWISSIDGALPAGALPDSEGLLTFSTANLSPGNHVITLQVIDKGAESATFDITLIINDVPEAPTVTILRPATGEDGAEGTPFDFKVAVSDAKDSPEQLTLSFESDIDGLFCSPVATPDGQAECSQSLSAGEHLLTFQATDQDGEVGSATAYFVVLGLEEQDNDGDGYSEVEGDCDDENADIGPTEAERENGIDDDCDDLIDEGTPSYDDDGDGFSELENDCDDGDSTVYPGAPESYDGDDEDCDGLIDEGTAGYDDDGDGFTETAGDCDDGYALTYPGATEIEDGNDNDCDGLTDEGTDAYDDDRDGYTEHGGDCDDDDAAINPGATEVCGDGDDNNCNGSADEAGASGCTYYYRDYDSDAYGTAASACLCTSEDYYTSRYSTDCYDYNASAKPGASTYYTANRGDGSYDYDCDSAETKYYSTTASCAYALGDCYVSTSGWDGSVRSCGSAGGYASTSDTDGCSWDWGSFACEVTGTTTVTQSCR